MTRFPNIPFLRAVLLLLFAALGPHAALAQVWESQAPPTCGAGYVPTPEYYGWACMPGTSYSPGLPPTCPANQTAILTGGTTWICEDNSSSDVQALEWSQNWLASVEIDDTNGTFANGCPAGTTLVMWPFGYPSISATSMLCLANSVAPQIEAALATTYPDSAGYFPTISTINADVQAQIVAAQVAAANAAVSAASYADSNGLGNMLCTVSNWFTGNVGKGLATLGIAIIGIGAVLSKISWKGVIIVGIGVAVIFAASPIVNALGGDLLSCTSHSHNR